MNLSHKHQIKKKEAVSALIFNLEKTEVLLVLRRDIPVWVLPGGGIEAGESPEEATVREVKEETGLDVAIVKKIAEYVPVSRIAHYTYFFECRVEKGEMTINEESRDIRFFPLKTLPKFFPPFYLEWLKDALSGGPFPLHKKMKGITFLRLFGYLFSHPILVARFLLSRMGIPCNTGDLHR